jgi:hypothetical protein
MTNLVKGLIVLGFAAVLTLVVVLLLYDAPFEYLLDCNRLQGTCTFTQRLLIKSKVGWAPIGSLERAEVRVEPRRGAPWIMVWVKSKSPSGDYFFADYTGRREAEEAAGKINAFLHDPSDGRLVLVRSVRATYWVAWALIPIVAALVVTLAAVLFRSKKPAAEGGGTRRNQLPSR